jgi:hypothetical protein
LKEAAAMFGFSLLKGAKNVAENTPDFSTLVDCLTPDVVTSLVNLHHVPDDVTNAVVQLLPIGTRFALIGAELAEPADIVAGRQKIRLTPLAYEVMEYLATHEDPDSNFEDWTRAEEEHVSAHFAEPTSP